MKAYKKSDLTFKDGRIFNKDNEVVTLPTAVYGLLNDLERLYQIAMYNNQLSVTMQSAVIKPFKFKSIGDREVDLGYEKPKTPVTDEVCKQSETVMKEADEVDRYNKINKLAKEYKHILFFIQDDELIASDSGKQYFDTFYLGDPLKLTVARFKEVIEFIVDNGATDGAIAYKELPCKC